MWIGILAAVAIMLGTLGLVPAYGGRPLAVSSTTTAVADWVNVTPAVSPPAVGGGLMAFSSAADKFVLFGGSTGDATNTTWTLSLGGTGWTQLHPALSPPERADGMMVYDSAVDAFIVFGGWQELPNGIYQRLGDTWVFYLGNDTWVPRHPAASPSPRSDAAIAYDAKADVTFLSGGFNGTAYLGDEWAYTFANDSWWPISPALMPSARADGRMTYDSQTNLFYLYGGNDYSGPNFTYNHIADTWTYAWTARQWTRLFASSTPGALDYAVLAADPTAGVLLMNGGYGKSVVLADTWVFNTTRGEWAHLNTRVTPPPRMAGVGGYDPVYDRFVVFSGGDVAVARDDTWVLAYPPTLSASLNASATAVAPGAPISFAATVTGGTGFVTAASWTFGDGSMGSGTNASHAFATAGTYPVVFQVTDADGHVAQATVQVTVGTGGLPWFALAAAAGVGLVALAAAVGIWVRVRRNRPDGHGPTDQPDKPRS